MAETGDDAAKRGQDEHDNKWDSNELEEEEGLHDSEGDIENEELIKSEEELRRLVEKDLKTRETDTIYVQSALEHGKHYRLLDKTETTNSTWDFEDNEKA